MHALSSGSPTTKALAPLAIVAQGGGGVFPVTHFRPQSVCRPTGPFPSPGDFPNQGIKPRSPAFQVDSLPAEPPGKPKNTGVCNPSLLQGIFPTQEPGSPALQADSLPAELRGKPL